MRRATSALLALLTACASRQADVDPEARYAAIRAQEQSCMRGELQPLHFSPSFFEEQPLPWEKKAAVDLSWPCVLSLQLRRMHEPPLWPAQQGERYRLLVFGHYDLPVAARIEVGSSLAEGVIMEGGADFCSDQEERRVRRTLNSDERDRVLAAVEAADFWRSPPTIRPAYTVLEDGDVLINTEVAGVRDGTSWIIEGVRDGQYRMFELKHRLGIKDNPRYADLFRVLEAAAGVRVRWSIEKAADTGSH
jgi:hypothetical protein